MYLKLSSVKWQPCCLGLNVLIDFIMVKDLKYVSNIFDRNTIFSCIYRWNSDVARFLGLTLDIVMIRRHPSHLKIGWHHLALKIRCIYVGLSGPKTMHSQKYYFMTMLWHGNAFRISDPLWWELQVTGVFSSQRITYAELSSFHLLLKWIDLNKVSSFWWFETP